MVMLRVAGIASEFVGMKVRSLAISNICELSCRVTVELHAPYPRI